MITLIIVLAWFTLIGLFIKEKEYDCLWGAVIMGGLMAFMFSLLALKLSDPCRVELYRVDQTYAIYSLRNTENLSGNFFLGSGKISNSEYYYMFAKNQGGGFIRNKILVNNCALYQDAKDQSYVRYQDIYYRPNKWVCFIPFKTMAKSSSDIHVPENTIIEKFQVN